ncbi:MAG TPA: phosphoadenylyl-sulfate reductase [Myxococcota bacterium]
MSDDVVALNERAARMSPQQIIGYGIERFGSELVIASSFSVEDVVLIDIAHRVSRRFRVVTLDTGRLPEETYDVIEQVRSRYGVTVEVFFPERARVEQLVSIKGTRSFRASVEDRKECCRVRKVEPLARALAHAGAWATGLRQAQSQGRASLPAFDVDERGLLKLAPLYRMGDAEVWAYAKEHAVPTSALYARGYTSIGCAPCTRAISAGEDARAGRWWWETPEHNECGIHTRSMQLLSPLTGGRPT